MAPSVQQPVVTSEEPPSVQQPVVTNEEPPSVQQPVVTTEEPPSVVDTVISTIGEAVGTPASMSQTGFTAAAKSPIMHGLPGSYSQEALSWCIFLGSVLT